MRVNLKRKGSDPLDLMVQDKPADTARAGAQKKKRGNAALLSYVVWV